MARARMNGEGTVYQRASDGRWVGAATVGWADGRRVRKIVSARTATEARAKLDALRHDIAQGLPAPDRRVTVGDLLDRWYRDVLRHQVAPLALSNYRTIAETHVRPAIGAKALAKLTPADIDQLLAAKRDAGLSISTVRRIRSVLAQAIKEAERWGLVGRNVAALSRPPKAQRTEGRSLTPDEARGLLAALSVNRNEALYTLMLTTGLRRGEVLGLRWDDVDLDESRLQVRHSLSWPRGGKPELLPPKTAASRRVIPIDRGTAETLRQHRRRQAAERLAAGPDWRNLNLVFCTRQGSYVEQKVVEGRLAALEKGSGVPAIRFHDLRHTHATLLLRQARRSIKEVSERLGHANVTVTLQLYAHVLADQHVEMAHVIGGVLDGGL